MLMRRAVAPLQEVCNRIMRFDTPLIDREMHPYFRDVQDHVIRVVESIDNLRELLTSALEANFRFVSVQQNDVTKKLAGWAAILAVPTAIAGIYGMNFENMPELKVSRGILRPIHPRNGRPTVRTMRWAASSVLPGCYHPRLRADLTSGDISKIY